jgi:hypothetical protein
MAENWMNTDEAEDVAGSIRHVIRTAQFVKDDPQAWKWIALGLHSALQGALVCHLTTTAGPIGAISKKNASEWLAYFEDSHENPDKEVPGTYLMNLPELVKAARKPNSSGNGSNFDGLRISDRELKWLCGFHENIRNQFVHFAPTGWELEVSGIPRLAALIARVIEDISQHGWAFRHKDTEWRLTMMRDIHALSSIDRAPSSLYEK